MNENIDGFVTLKPVFADEKRYYTQYKNDFNKALCLVKDIIGLSANKEEIVFSVNNLKKYGLFSFSTLPYILFEKILGLQFNFDNISSVYLGGREFQENVWPDTKKYFYNNSELDIDDKVFYENVVRNNSGLFKTIPYTYGKKGASWKDVTELKKEFRNIFMPAMKLDSVKMYELSNLIHSPENKDEYRHYWKYFKS